VAHHPTPDGLAYFVTQYALVLPMRLDPLSRVTLENSAAI
jgi:hypothetical protein